MARHSKNFSTKYQLSCVICMTFCFRSARCFTFKRRIKMLNAWLSLSKCRNKFSNYSFPSPSNRTLLTSSVGCQVAFYSLLAVDCCIGGAVMISLTKFNCQNWQWPVITFPMFGASCYECLMFNWLKVSSESQLCMDIWLSMPVYECRMEVPPAAETENFGDKDTHMFVYSVTAQQAIYSYMYVLTYFVYSRRTSGGLSPAKFLSTALTLWLDCPYAKVLMSRGKQWE